MSAIDLSPEPDLHPLYPTPAHVSPLLDTSSGLSPTQRAELVSHALSRATAFGDLSLLTYLLGDRAAAPLVDLQSTDEDGLSALSATITGFGAESERDVEREECVRLLVAEGADVGAEDASGWTALHHAALRAPPTVVAFLLTHGASLFATTRRGLTPLDIVAAHTTVPGREDVALLLAEAMRSQGWEGGRMDARRKAVEARMAKRTRRRRVQEDVGRVLAISARWWGDADVWDDDESSDGSDDEGEDVDERVYTPPPDYGSMLVFAPPSLPYIFHSLITDFAPALRNAEPANALYMLARFACLACDNTWLEDLIIGATDAIEDAFFNRSEDLEVLVFWLYNTTTWLHLMRCDNAINETCEALGSFVLIEEVINSVFVFIIRYIERHIDGLLDIALLDHAALPTEFNGVQFEDEWSFLRSFKKKPAPPSQPHTPTRPTTPPPSQPVSPRGNFASLRNTFSRARAGSAAPTTPLQSLFAAEQAQQQAQPSPPAGPSPADITDFFDALQTLLTLSGINPALITQMWSQVIYWIACELFNRILSRKKYLCRSRAVQIGMNIGALEEWAARANLPRGVVQHLAPVRDLLNWLQCLSSITEFTALITTVQTMRHLNPLQMRRAVRDYRYEVNEGRMDDECAQYLAQLQKDWERHRVKMGVEALRKEMSERERDDSDSVSLLGDSGSAPKLASSASSLSLSTTDLTPHNSVDLLFAHDAAADGWTPTRPPEILGELLDSRHMLPLLLPSDPRLLAAAPKRPAVWTAKGSERQHGADSRASSRASRRAAGVIPWRASSKAVRAVTADVLAYVDGGRWARYGPSYGYEGEPDGEMEFEGDESFDEARGFGHEADITLTAPEDGGLEPEYVAGLTAKPHRARSAAASPAVGAVDLPS